MFRPALSPRNRVAVAGLPPSRPLCPLCRDRGCLVVERVARGRRHVEIFDACPQCTRVLETQWRVACENSNRRAA